MSDIYITPVGVGAPKRVVEAFAERMASVLDYEIGGSLEEVVASHGGKIVFGSTGKEDHESGSIIARDMTDYTIYLSQNTSRVRDRFTIAHELGHLMLHLPKIKEAGEDAVMRATRWVDDSDDGQKRAELEANWFAAAFLMPATKFRQAYADHGVEYAKEVFDVSRAAIDTRARTLGL
jgi:Zn-dependent peptidase ImmA (M78 family)